MKINKNIIILVIICIILSGIGIYIYKNKQNNISLNNVISTYNKDDIYKILKEKIKILSEKEVYDLWLNAPLSTEVSDILYKELKRRGYFKKQKIKNENKALKQVEKLLKL